MNHGNNTKLHMLLFHTNCKDGFDTERLSTNMTLWTSPLDKNLLHHDNADHKLYYI